MSSVKEKGETKSTKLNYLYIYIFINILRLTKKQEGNKKVSHKCVLENNYDERNT